MEREVLVIRDADRILCMASPPFRTVPPNPDAHPVTCLVVLVIRALLRTRVTWPPATCFVSDVSSLLLTPDAVLSVCMGPSPLLPTEFEMNLQSDSTFSAPYLMSGSMAATTRVVP